MKGSIVHDGFLTILAPAAPSGPRVPGITCTGDGMIHDLPTRSAPTIRLWVSHCWTRLCETPSCSAACLLEMNDGDIMVVGD